MAQMTELSQRLDDCVSNCKEVVTVASDCAMHCLAGEDPGKMEDCIRLCLDAAEVASACLMMASRNSEHVDKICGVTAAVTDACATMCESMADGDRTMENCAKSCRSCADACRTVIGTE